MYQKEIKALKKANRYRQRKVFDNSLVDMASNDYLGLSSRKKSLKKAYKLLKRYDSFAPKASMLVNGYHPIHKEFEEILAKSNGFESGIVVGSGFLANLALIEALVRKNDVLFMDEEYHASGVMASKLLGDRVIFFRHNDTKHLNQLLEKHSYYRAIIAIEGVYSMSGDVCKKEIFDIANEYEALLIVDEAHSAGVLGENLFGVYEYYQIPIASNHIKMGTLGKAYGSYGAYILASNHIVEFLQNRAKPIIYSTAPSVFDTALALVNFKYIQKHTDKLKLKKAKLQTIIKNRLSYEIESLILPIEMQSSNQALELQQQLLDRGVIVGAIRPPTVDKPILRVIPNLSIKVKDLDMVLRYITQRF